jgi:hypothetical protein
VKHIDIRNQAFHGYFFQAFKAPFSGAAGMGVTGQGTTQGDGCALMA